MATFSRGNVNGSSNIGVSRSAMETVDKINVLLWNNEQNGVPDK